MISGLSIGHEDEAKRLSVAMASGVNSAIAAPSGWGKTTLLREAARRLLARDPHAIVCPVDLTAVRSDLDFYNRLVGSLLAVSNTTRELLPGATHEFPGEQQIDLTSADLVRNNLIDLPLRLSELSKARLVVILEPFDSFFSIAEPSTLARCREAWQRHRTVSYCLAGSQMMESSFARRESPFYKFCDLMLLRKIPHDVMVMHLVRSSVAAGKNIPGNVADHLCSLVNDHTGYIEELVRALLLRPEAHITMESVDQVMIEAQHHHAPHFRTVLQHLSDTQVNLLRAVVSGVERYTSVAAMNRYRLGTPRNVVKNRQALIRSGIFGSSGRKLTIIDPLFEQWLKTVL